MNMGLFGKKKTVLDENLNTGLIEPDKSSLSKNEFMLIEFFKQAVTTDVEITADLVEFRDKLSIPKDEKTYILFARKTFKKLFGKEIFGVVTRKKIYFYTNKAAVSFDLEQLVSYRVGYYDYSIMLISNNSDEPAHLLYHEGFFENSDKYTSITKQLGSFIIEFQKAWYLISDDAKKEVDSISQQLIDRYKDIESIYISGNDLEWIRHLLMINEKSSGLWRLIILNQVNKGNIPGAVYDLNRHSEVFGNPKEVCGEIKKHLEVLISQIRDNAINDDTIDSYRKIYTGHVDIYGSDFLQEDIKKYDSELIPEIKEIYKLYEGFMHYIEIGKCMSIDSVKICEYANSFEDVQKNEFIKYALQYKNRKMLDIYIKDDYSNDTYNYVDGFGLTPVYYLFIKRQIDKLSGALIKARSTYGNKDGTLSEYYSLFKWSLYYCVLAEIPSEKAEQHLYDIMHNMDEFRPTKEIISQLERRIKFQEAKQKVLEFGISNNRSLISAAKRAYANQIDGDISHDQLMEKVGEYENNIILLDEKYNEIEEYIKGLREELNEAEEDYARLMYIKAESLAQSVLEWAHSDEVLVKLIWMIMSGKLEYAGVLKDSLSSEAELFQFNGIYFCMTQKLYDSVKQYSYKDKSHGCADNNSEKSKPNREEAKADRLYGKSWFTSEAHTNWDKLKQEYRKLVKIYHPDVDPNGVNTFMDIQLEYSQIMEQFDK